VVVVVLVVRVVVVEVAVVGAMVVDVEVVVVLGAVGSAVVVGAVVVGMLLVARETVVVADELPLSDAITARATPRPITTATRRAIAAFIAVLIPPPRGGSDSGSLMTWVGSSCMAARV
jgi:hypothetical protein